MAKMKINARADGLYECPSCHKALPTRQGLTGHMHWTHKGKHPLGGGERLMQGKAEKEVIAEAEAIIRKSVPKPVPKPVLEPELGEAYPRCTWDPMTAFKPEAQEIMRRHAASEFEQRSLAWAMLRHVLSGTECPGGDCHMEALADDYKRKMGLK